MGVHWLVGWLEGGGEVGVCQLCTASFCRCSMNVWGGGGGGADVLGGRGRAGGGGKGGSFAYLERHVVRLHDFVAGAVAAHHASRAAHRLPYSNSNLPRAGLSDRWVHARSEEASLPQCRQSETARQQKAARAHLGAVLIALDVARCRETVAHEDRCVRDASPEQLGEGGVLCLVLVAGVAPLCNDLRWRSGVR